MCYCVTKKKVVFVAITYLNIWIMEVGESLICEREPLISRDGYIYSGFFERQSCCRLLPRQLSQILSLFILPLIALLLVEKYILRWELKNPCKLFLGGKCEEM